jgi:hypothetical protein
MQNVDTRVVAHAVRAGGSRVSREMAAARAALARPVSERDAAVEEAAARLTARLRARPVVRVRPRRAAVAGSYSGA